MSVADNISETRPEDVRFRRMFWNSRQWIHTILTYLLHLSAVEVDEVVEVEVAVEVDAMIEADVAGAAAFLTGRDPIIFFKYIDRETAVSRRAIE